jgi:O-antigen/teichoic acid export membrane protein
VEEAASTRRVMPRLLSESAVYGIGGVANQALTVLLVPIYARQLGTDGYGVVAIVNATLSISSYLATLALPQAFLRAWLKEADDDRERQHALAVSYSLRIVVSAAFLLLFSLTSIPLTMIFFGGSLSELPLIALIGPNVFCDTLNLVPLSYLRAERRPLAYTSISFSRAILGSILIIGFVVGLKQGPLGVVLGSSLSALVSATAGALVLRRLNPVRLAWDSAFVRHMLAFSLPLVPASIAAWGLNQSDRYVVRAFDGFSAAGIYSSGYTAGTVITAVAVAPFTLTWGAAYWEISRGSRAPQVISRVLTVFMVVACGLALGLAAVGTDAIRILLGDDFGPGRFVVPFSAFSGVLYGTYTIVTTGLNLESQTRWVPVTMIAAAVGNVLLNLLLVPILGFMGAALSSLISYLQLTITSGIISQRYYPVPWEYVRATVPLVLGLALAAAALLGPDNPLWRLACLAAYPLLVVVLRVVRPAEVTAVRSLVTSRFGSRSG